MIIQDKPTIEEILAQPPKTGVEVSIGYIQRDIEKINDKLDNTYVTRDEFSPVKNVVYGMVGLILTAVLAAIVYGVVTH